MPQYRIAEAAKLLGISDDTLRRQVDAGAVATAKDHAGRSVIEGADLAELARAQADPIPDPSPVLRSARNHLVGLVTHITADTVMAQVELQCGRERVVSLMSTEAVREMGLVPGSVAVAIIKSTTVVVETPTL